MNAIEKLFPVSQQERSFQLKVRRDAGTAAPGWVQPQFVECKKCGRRATRQVWTKKPVCMPQLRGTSAHWSLLPAQHDFGPRNL